MPRLVCLLLLAIPFPVYAAEPEWGSDLEAAKRQAKKEDRPVFVVFRCEH